MIRNYLLRNLEIQRLGVFICQNIIDLRPRRMAGEGQTGILANVRGILKDFLDLLNFGMIRLNIKIAGQYDGTGNGLFGSKDGIHRTIHLKGTQTEVTVHHRNDPTVDLQLNDHQHSILITYPFFPFLRQSHDGNSTKRAKP